MPDLTKRGWRSNPLDDSGSPTFQHLGTQELYDMVYEMQDRLERMRKHKTPRITSSPFDNGRVFPYPVR